jgi:HSP20 family molecular chaperone IbpA
MTKEIQTQKEEVQPAEGIERTRATRVYVPKVDIYSEDDGVILLVEMPGVDENEIDISLEKKVLTINGFVSPIEPEGYDLTYAEYNVGDYQRSFTLPDELDTDSIEAIINNGVLRITLAKAPEAQTKKITVKAG